VCRLPDYGDRWAGTGTRQEDGPNLARQLRMIKDGRGASTASTTVQSKPDTELAGHGESAASARASSEAWVMIC